MGTYRKNMLPPIPSSVHMKSRDWHPWNGDLEKNLEYIYINHSFHTHSIWNPWNEDLKQKLEKKCINVLHYNY